MGDPLRQATALCLDSLPNAPEASVDGLFERSSGAHLRGRFADAGTLFGTGKRRAAGCGTVANIRHALDVTASSEGLGRWKTFLAWARVPMQIPLIWAALQNRRAATLSLGISGNKRVASGEVTLSPAALGAR